MKLPLLSVRVLTLSADQSEPLLTVKMPPEKVRAARGKLDEPLKVRLESVPMVREESEEPLRLPPDCRSMVMEDMVAPEAVVIFAVPPFLIRNVPVVFTVGRMGVEALDKIKVFPELTAKIATLLT